MRCTWAPGRPGGNGGVAHLAKHYLDPPEHWQDLCRDVPAELSAHAVWRELAGQRDADAVARSWSLLSRAFEQGYGAIARSAVDAAGPPGSGQADAVGWVCQDQKRYIGHVGEGILAVVASTGRGWAMVTAYRPVVAPVASYECRNPDTRQHRARLAVATWKAKAMMSFKRERQARRTIEDGE